MNELEKDEIRKRKIIKHRVNLLSDVININQEEWLNSDIIMKKIETDIIERILILLKKNKTDKFIAEKLEKNIELIRYYKKTRGLSQKAFKYRQKVRVEELNKKLALIEKYSEEGMNKSQIQRRMGYKSASVIDYYINTYDLSIKSKK